MSLAKLNFEEISESDLSDLIETGVPEGILIEYKRDSYGSNDAGVKEFLKDVSSFANSGGGHLVIGIDETGGVASGLSPLPGDADQELQRLESLSRDGIEPRIMGLRMRAIQIAPQGFVVVIRIPRSWNPPHRVMARNTNRIYLRNSAGAYEASLDELRALFTMGATAQDSIRAFRARRLALIEAGDTGVSLASSHPDRLVFHLVPLSAHVSRDQVDPKRAYQLHTQFPPMASSGYSQRYNFDGFINTYGADACLGYTQVFRNGSIEAVKVGILVDDGGSLRLPSLVFEKRIVEVLPTYLQGMQSLDVSPPIVLMLSLQGVRGAWLGVSQEQMILDPPAPIGRSTLELPEAVIESYGSAGDYERAIQPALDALWNAAGYAKSRYFTPQGRWVGRPTR